MSNPIIALIANIASFGTGYFVGSQKKHAITNPTDPISGAPIGAHPVPPPSAVYSDKLIYITPNDINSSIFAIGDNLNLNKLMLIDSLTVDGFFISYMDKLTRAKNIDVANRLARKFVNMAMRYSSSGIALNANAALRYDRNFETNLASSVLVENVGAELKDSYGQRAVRSRKCQYVNDVCVTLSNAMNLFLSMPYDASATVGSATYGVTISEALIASSQGNVNQAKAKLLRGEFVLPEVSDLHGAIRSLILKGIRSYYINPHNRLFIIKSQSDDGITSMAPVLTVLYGINSSLFNN